MAKTNGSPTGIQHPSERHGAFWAQKCAESQQAFDRLQEHLGTRPVMDAEFDKKDSTCIELAREFRVLADAGSPKAESAYTRLVEARAKRDSGRREWTRKTDELREKVMGYTDPEILGLKRAVAGRNQTLWGLLSVEFRGDAKFFDDTREVTVRDNFQGVNRAIQEQIEYIRRAERLRERPLAELLDLVAESGRVFSEQRDFPERLMEERKLPASQYRELQGAAVAASQSFDALRAQRMPIYLGPFGVGGGTS